MIHNHLDPGMDPITIRAFCKDRAETEEEEQFSDILYKPDDARKQKSDILGYFSSLFNIHPNILRVGSPEAEYRHVH